MKVIQSTIEREAWVFVLLLLFATCAIIYLQVRQGQQIKSGVMQIEQQIKCISIYFNQTDRSSLTINNLKDCDIKRQ